MLIVSLFLGVNLFPTAPSIAAQSSWQQVQGVRDADPGIMFLLMDGTVLVQDQGVNNSGSERWWILTPDSKGDYFDGTWSRTGDMPKGYKPLYASSGVLPDGRVIVEGGEVNGSSKWVGENLGAIYDPIAKSWSAVSPPNQGHGKFASIADGPSVVLANGRFMFGPAGAGDTGELGQTKQAVLNPLDLSWSITGQGMLGANPESGYTLLPNNKILMIDTPLNSGKKTEIFNPASGVWSSGGTTPDSLLDPTTALGEPVAEIGPAIVMPNGKVFAEGSNQHTAIYNYKSNKWSRGPDFPVVNGKQVHADDAGSAILQNGSVLFDASPINKGKFAPPVSFFIFDGKKIQQIDPPSDQSRVQSNFPYFLALPNGQVLVNERLGSQNMYLYTSQGNAKVSWVPIINDVATNLVSSKIYTLKGRQLSGLTEGSSFGDDCNNQTNYPLIKITNQKTGKVFYARALDVSSTSIAPGNSSTMQFIVPSGVDGGPSTLQVVASGFTSDPVNITISDGLASDL